MLSLILAESSLELVPFAIQSHPSIMSHADKLGKHPSKILLDNSWHFAGMKGIENEIKRGRPDLVHFSILEATSIPLYYENKLKFFIHTTNDKVISFAENVHIPKSYHRFAGLFEKLFLEKVIKSSNQELLSIKDQSFSQLIDELAPSQVIGLSTTGKQNSFQHVAANLDNDSCIIVGGFQKGHFSDSVSKRIDHLFSINSTPLESHVVVARMLHECEKTIFM